MPATLTPATPDPTSAPGSLESLSAQTRRLWSSEPAVAPSEREGVVLELADIDLVLERLALRGRWSALDRSDLDELQACAVRLSRLQRHWVAD